MIGVLNFYLSYLHIFYIILSNHVQNFNFYRYIQREPILNDKILVPTILYINIINY